MRKTVLPVHQARSRDSLSRLLKATVEVLDEDGIEGATIPRIAARASVSPGTVYRRFRDKDALLREVCLRMLEDGFRQTSEFLAVGRWERKSLKEIVRSVIALTLKGQRAHRGLLRAMLFFTLQHPDAAFVRKSAELQRKTFEDLAELLLSRRGEIRHPHPELAVKFAMLMVGVAAQGTITLPRNPGALSRLVPGLEDQFEHELARMCLRFLGIED
jgi:AcrR family transcriptional regulator